MIQIPDDPIIACMERTGYPPWFETDREASNDEEDSDDTEGEYE